MLAVSKLVTNFLEQAVTSQCPVTITTASTFEVKGIVHAFDSQWVEFQPLNTYTIEDGPPLMFLISIREIEVMCFSVSTPRMEMLRRFGELHDKLDSVIPEEF